MSEIHLDSVRQRGSSKRAVHSRMCKSIQGVAFDLTRQRSLNQAISETVEGKCSKSTHRFLSPYQRAVSALHPEAKKVKVKAQFSLDGRTSTHSFINASRMIEEDPANYQKTLNI